jgi:hypothetical protein
MNLEDCSEQEKQYLDLGYQFSESKNISVITMYDECHEMIKLDWVKKKLEERHEKHRSSSFEPFTL